MNCNTPGFPVLHYLPEFAQTHVHWISDAIQPSHPLSSASPPALSLSQHQGLFQGVGSSHQVAKVLELQFQHQSFQWIFGWFPLGVTSLECSPAPQFESFNFSASAFFMVHPLHPYMTTGKTITLTIWTSVAKWYLCFLISCLGLSWLSFQGVRVF